MTALAGLMPEIFLDMFWRFYGFGFVRFLDRSWVRTGRFYVFRLSAVRLGDDIPEFREEPVYLFVGKVFSDLVQYCYFFFRQCYCFVHGCLPL